MAAFTTGGVVTLSGKEVSKDKVSAPTRSVVSVARYPMSTSNTASTSVGAAVVSARTEAKEYVRDIGVVASSSRLYWSYESRWYSDDFVYF